MELLGKLINYKCGSKTMLGVDICNVILIEGEKRGKFYMQDIQKNLILRKDVLLLDVQYTKNMICFI